MAIYDNRVCKQCGRTFSGGPRAWYCPECRAERKKEQSRTSKWREVRGLTRKIGSEAICQNCGSKYTINSANQKYCEKCADEMHRKVDNEQGIKYYRERINKAERNIKRRSYYAKNKAILNLKRRIYYAHNREKILLAAKARNKKTRKHYYLVNKDKILLANKKWRQNNAEYLNRYSVERYWSKKAHERTCAFVLQDGDLDIVYGNCAKHLKTPYFRGIDGTEYDDYKLIDDLTDDEKTRFVRSYNAINNTFYTLEEIIKLTMGEELDIK